MRVCLSTFTLSHRAAGVLAWHRRASPLAVIRREGLCLHQASTSTARVVSRLYAEPANRSVAYQEFDVVEFVSSEDSGTAVGTAIGCIVSIAGDEVEIEALQRDPEDDASIWTQSGDEYVVPLSALKRTFDADFSQRIDTDRVSNPHGEHAHDVWEIPELL